MTMSKKKRNKRFPGKNNTRTKGKKKNLFIVIFAGLALVAGGLYFYDSINKGDSAERYKNQQAATPLDPSFLRGGEKRPTLSPARFTGKVAAAYKIAEQNPVLLDSMYCYCNCKKTIGHKSLLSCYADNHAAGCGICRDEAYFALSQYQSGMNIVEVRKAVDKRFWRPLS
jgi:hypothetical protein